MLVYLALSSLLVGFYGLWDGKHTIAAVLLATGALALAIHRMRNNNDNRAS